MGKAGKWIKNFLIGKKEDLEKKEVVMPPVTYAGTSTVIVPSTLRVRRRWSFGRSKSKEIFQHKLCKSLDAMDVPVQLMIEYAKTRNISPWVISTEPCYDFRDKAATKIQAVFRSFLARKALCALRGLVKIQALVRSHLVRKQTTATLRCMHALMTIQVRARVQRIKMAEEEQAVVTRQSWIHRRFPQIGVSNSETGMESSFYPSRLRYERRGEEKSLTTHGSLRHCPSKTISSPEETVGEEQQPSYMATTKSSKAKERAQSEPKQRPDLGTREKGRKSVSIEGVGVYGLGKNCHSTATLSVSTTKSICHSRFVRDYGPHLRLC